MRVGAYNKAGPALKARKALNFRWTRRHFAEAASPGAGMLSRSMREGPPPPEEGYGAAASLQLRRLEATPGIEPGYTVLQTVA